MIKTITLTFVGGLVGGIVSQLARLKSDQMGASFKARQEQLDALSKMISRLIKETQELSAQYWNEPDAPNQAILAGRINGNVDQIGGLCALMLGSENSRKLWGVIRNFKKAVTGGDFECSGRLAEPGRVREIYATGIRLEAAILMYRSKLTAFKSSPADPDSILLGHS